MVSQNFRKDTFINQDINFLVSNYIREYDIQKANISILLSEGMISQDEYDYYHNMNSDTRKVALGCLQRDNEDIKKCLNDGFVKYRKLFFEANDIQDEHLLSINKDSICLINKVPKYTLFNKVLFRPKEVYTSYYKYNRYGIYYIYDKIKDTEIINVKGMQKHMSKHDGYMNELFKCIFDCAESASYQEAAYILSSFLDNYMKLNVDVEYYREYNDFSQFRVKESQFSRFSLEFADDKMLPYLDVSYNRVLMETILSYYASIII